VDESVWNDAHTGRFVQQNYSTIQVKVKVKVKVAKMLLFDQLARN